MWYSKNSPAPALSLADEHPLSSRTKLPLLRPTWAPLSEPAHRRREQWYSQRRLQGRSSSAGSLTHVGVRAATAPYGQAPSATPVWVQAWLQERVSATASGERGGSTSLLPVVARRGSACSSCSRISRFSGVRSRLDREGSERSLPRSLAASVAPGSASRPSTAASQREAAAEEDLPQRRERTPKRRNTLCDKLLEARLTANAAKPAHRQLLLAGRSLSKGATSRFFTTFEHAEAAFHHTAHGGALCLGTALAEAFLLLDYPYPVPAIMNNIITNCCEGRESLDCDDFVAVLWKFEEDLRAKLKKVFADHTPGGGDAFEASLLPRVLIQAGAPTMPGVADELLEDVRGEFGRPLQGVSYATFERIYEEVVSRACLSEKEHDRLSAMFEAAEDERGTVGEQELIGLLTWHDTVVQLVGGEEFIQRLATEAIRRTQLGVVDLDLKGWIDAIFDPPSPSGGSAARAAHRATGSAFLAASRVIHEKLLRKLQATMLELHMPIGQGSIIRPSELVRLVDELGFYFAVESSVHEFLMACGLEHLGELSFDQVYRCIFRFVCSDGLTEEEVGEIARAFRKFDADGSGRLDVAELGPVVRWLGYQPNQYRIYCFAEEAKLQEDSSLALEEFVKLVSSFMKHSLVAVRKTFKGSEVRLQDIGHLLELVGYEPTEAEILELKRKAGGEDERPLDFHDFKRLERLHRKAIRVSMEKNAGCTNAEMEKYRGYFDANVEGSFTEHAEPHMSNRAVRMLLAGMFPDSALDRQRHQRIAQLVRDADSDGNGVFDFDEYLWLMRKVSDIMDRENLVRGLQLKKVLGYTREEAKQFRDLFAVADEDGSGSIDVDELCALLGNLVEMDEDARQDIRERFSAVDDGDGQLDFWEFLHFMRKIQDENWRKLGTL